MNTKEAWQMTKEEYLKSHGSSNKKFAGNVTYKQHNTEWHYKFVAGAVADGKPVPPEVLRDYPELKRQAEIDAKKQFEAKWAAAYGNRPETVKFEKPFPAPKKPAGKIPNLDNSIDLHPDNKNWRNYLQNKELREQRNNVKHYVSSNAHYIVLPNGDVSVFYGYAGQAAYNEASENPGKWIKERDKALNEIDQILHPKTDTGKLQSIHNDRTPQSKAMDEAQKHSITLQPNSPRSKLWIKDQGVADIEGIDTYKGRISPHSLRITPKTPRITPRTPKLRR